MPLLVCFWWLLEDHKNEYGHPFYIIILYLYVEVDSNELFPHLYSIRAFFFATDLKINVLTEEPDVTNLPLGWSETAVIGAIWRYKIWETGPIFGEIVITPPHSNPMASVSRWGSKWLHWIQMIKIRINTQDIQH